MRIIFLNTNKCNVAWGFYIALYVLIFRDFQCCWKFQGWIRIQIKALTRPWLKIYKLHVDVVPSVARDAPSHEKCIAWKCKTIISCRSSMFARKQISFSVIYKFAHGFGASFVPGSKHKSGTLAYNLLNASYINT